MKAITFKSLILVTLFTMFLGLSKSFAQNCNCDYTIPLTATLVDANNLNLPAGATVCIAAGNRVNLKLLNFQGTAAAPITFKNCGGQVNIQNSTIGYGLYFANSKYFIVDGTGTTGVNYGFRIAATKQGSNSLVASELSTNFEIHHVEINGSGFSGMMLKTDPKCDLTANRGNFTMRNIIIHDNYVHNVKGEGFYIGNSFYNGWTGNSQCTGTTLYPHDIRMVRIYNNVVEHSGCEAIQLGCAVEDVKVYNNSVRWFGEDPFANYQNNGVQFGLGTMGDFYNNKIQDGPGNGFLTQGKGNVKAFNNLIVNAGDNGIFCDDITTGPMVGNYSFYNNTIVNTGDDGIRVYSDLVTMNYIQNNIIIKPASGLFIKKLNSNVKTTEANNYTSADLSAPKFVNATSGDYKLQSGSPAVNTGMNLSANGVTFDHENKSRPSGGIFDCGAYEFQATTQTTTVTANAGADKSALV